MFSQKRFIGGGIIVWENHKGERHREDGPAVEHPDGFREWWSNGQLHRLDGPALEYPGLNTAWYLNGKRFSEAEFYVHLEKHHEKYGVVP